MLKLGASEPKRLTLRTFFCVLITVTTVGAVAIPIQYKRVEARLLDIQKDVNARRSKAVRNFVKELVSQGWTPIELAAIVRTLVSGTSVDRGFSCIYDRENHKFLAYPNSEVPISPTEIYFSDLGTGLRGGSLSPWGDVLESENFSVGLLHFPDDSIWFVHSETISEPRWTISTFEDTTQTQQNLAKLKFTLAIGSVLAGLIIAVVCSLVARVISRIHEKKVEYERQRSDNLLLNIFPKSIIVELKTSNQLIAKRHACVTTLFADVVGFTPLAEKTSAEELVSWLNKLFCEFDDISSTLKLEKIKTIGDAYMLCGGLDSKCAEKSAQTVIKAAKLMIEATEKIEPPSVVSTPLKVRIGVHSGELVAGVIGKNKFSYDVWGDAVNIASRFESTGVEGKIHLSDETAQLLAGSFLLEDRRVVNLKGRGSKIGWFIS